MELLTGLEISSEDPSLIDLDSDLQVNDTTRAPSSSLGFFSDIVGEVEGLLNTQPSQTPSLLDGAMTEDLSLSPDLDGLPLPTPQGFPHLNTQQVVVEAPREDRINEAQLQEPLSDSQHNSQATSIHGEDSAESTVEDVAQGIDSENTDQAASL
ncbi:hypothetical protein B9Z19DRAFT_1075788 [Tuber borchii]|uniref:Uncharacterized protein n=1 Tax=Tuber borchii TaxID=42251 RepID=A0A2T7A2Y6_TUBBO|nr:hypothetical protein B9Z19DRAFT_1075788 [Tuber borchii]